MKRAAPILALALVPVVLATAALCAGACSSAGPDPATVGNDTGLDSSTGAKDGDTSATEGGVGDGASGTDGSVVDASGGEAGTSCVGVAATCGGNKDCCASSVVVGGMFNRSNDGAFPATVGDFGLDVYEVTVGRFRVFVNAGKGTQASPPGAGDGAHPKIASSGWSASWSGELATDTAGLRASLKCNAAYPSWTDAPAGKETNPINCVTWFEAFAFCAWDGGRLPTEAEWNYAAAGGSEQRAYAWGANIDHTMAAYDCSGRGQETCLFSDMRPVGSFSPQGDGKWGHADLTGNVWEYTLDYSAVPYRLTTCADCADLQPASYRTFRGGSFANESFNEVTSLRLERSPAIADYDVGVRCARAAAP